MVTAQTSNVSLTDKTDICHGRCVVVATHLLERAADSIVQPKRVTMWPGTNNAIQVRLPTSCHYILRDVTFFSLILWMLIAQRVHLGCQRTLEWLN